MDISNIIFKIKALRVLSTSPNIHEALAATAAANKLIDAYRLSEAEFETNNSNHLEQDPIDDDPDAIYKSGKITVWKKQLISIITNHYGLAYFNNTTYTTGRKVSNFCLVGRKSDIALAKYMFAWLTAECQRLSNLNAKGRGRVYVNSYCSGFVSGVAIQLKLSREEVSRVCNSSALVKINQRLQDATEAMYRFHPDLKTLHNKSNAQYDNLAFSSGYQAGKNTHLGQSLNTGAGKLLRS